MLPINIISSGSDGNAVIYFDRIMVDCGVPFAALSDTYKNISLVLLTHRHRDHFNIRTIKTLSKRRPALRFICGEHLRNELEEIRNVDIIQPGYTCDYGPYQISPVYLYHDTPNFGYRIYKDDIKIFHATDTAHLQGITAPDCDLYAIEANYDEDNVYDIIRENRLRGKYDHHIGAINSHLSIQQAQNFALQNGTPGKSKLLILHQSKDF